MNTSNKTLFKWNKSIIVIIIIIIIISSSSSSSSIPLLSNCATSVFVHRLFDYLLSNWPFFFNWIECNGTAYILRKIMVSHFFFFKNYSVIYSGFFVIFIASFLCVVVCCLYWCIFLMSSHCCAVCNWPCGCWASTYITKNWTKLNYYFYY